MKFDNLVNEMLAQNTMEESWKHKLAIGAAALGMMGGNVKASDEGMSPKQIENQRRIEAATAIAKGERPAPKYKQDDQSPEAKAYRERMKRIEAGYRLSKANQ